MMFMGNSKQIIRGNRVVGATTSNHKARKIDPDTLAVSTAKNAITLTPAHIHHALRKLAGIGQLPPASTKFILGGTDIPNLF